MIWREARSDPAAGRGQGRTGGVPSAHVRLGLVFSTAARPLGCCSGPKQGDRKTRDALGNFGCRGKEWRWQA